MSRTSFTAGERAVVSFAGELDSANSDEMRDAFESLSEGAPVVVIDLTSVVFMDSSALGAVIGGIRRVRAIGAEPVLCASRPSIKRILNMTGIDRLVPVEGSLEEALRRPAVDDTLAPA